MMSRTVIAAGLMILAVLYVQQHRDVDVGPDDFHKDKVHAEAPRERHVPTNDFAAFIQAPQLDARVNSDVPQLRTNL